MQNWSYFLFLSWQQYTSVPLRLLSTVKYSLSATIAIFLQTEHFFMRHHISLTLLLLLLYDFHFVHYDAETLKYLRTSFTVENDDKSHEKYFLYYNLFHSYLLVQRCFTVLLLNSATWCWNQSFTFQCIVPKSIHT